MPASGAQNSDFSNLDSDWNLEELSFETVNLFGSRSAGRIQTITQSRNGLIWIGSQQGLYRYDGRRVLPFYSDPRDSTSIPNDSVTALHVDSKGRLWVATEQGAALFQEDKEEFIRYLQPEQTGDGQISSQVNGIGHTSDGTVYATNEAGRVFSFDEQSGNFVEATNYRFGAIKSLSIDLRDRLWIGSNDAVYVFNPQTQEIQSFTEPIVTQDAVTINYVLGISYLDESEVWLATSTSGLIVLNPSTGAFQRIPASSQPESYANGIYSDQAGRMWAINNAGLTLYDRSTKEPILQPQNDADRLKTPPSGINSLFVDHQGSIWIGSNYDGVSKSTSYKRFETIDLHARNPEVRAYAPVAAFVEDGGGNLWVGHPESGLAMYPRDGDSVLRIFHEPGDDSSLTDQPILCLFEDSKGQIWIGTYRGGLYRYRPGTGELTGFHHDPDDPHSLGGHDIRAIDEDSDGALWFATHGSGVISYDPDNEQFANYTLGTRDETSFYIPNDWINTLLIDSEQNIWLSARNGVVKISKDRKSYQHFEADANTPGALSHSQTIDLFEDSKGRMWIATKDGLNLFLPETHTFKSYSVPEGLPDRTIVSIIEDERGFLWLGTLGGLARFDPETELTRTFDTTDGLSSDDFFETKVARGIGGMLYFGQNKGITRFNPNEIVDDGVTPRVFITGLRVFGTPLQVSDKSPLEKSMLQTAKIELRHDQNALVFEFVAVDFKNPAKNQYRFKLEGFDKDWSIPSNKAEAIYTNIPSGNYIFRVQASNIDGFWNYQGDTLAVQITPPFWGTLSFRVILIIFVITVPIALFFWRINSIRNEARRLEVAVAKRTKDLKQANIWLEEANAKTQSHGELLERTVRERTKELEIAKDKAEHSDRLKSAFLANMSHEIRTPMNAIIGFLHMLESTDLRDEERRHFHEIISQSSKSLMSLIDDILDLSAIEAGEAEIALQPSDIDEICEELGALFRESLLAQKKGKVSYKFEKNVSRHLEEAGPLITVIDPLRLKQILWNLLSNALKFTEEGEIRLRVSVKDDEGDGSPEIHFSVKDTGIGIPKEEHKRIFNRFHKLDEDGKKLYRGTGLGLAITQTLTTLMDGVITLESEPNVGTQFFVTFPYRSKLESTDPASKHAKLSSDRNEVDLSAFNLLVVEDETPNFEYISRVLKRTGINIQWVDRGGTALEKFKSQPFDLVLLDLKLPEVDGHEIARQIREIAPDIPIIVQSAFAMRDDVHRSKEAGANEHLSKPFSPGALIDILSKYLLKTTDY
ncbi:two-component regulator propeller domain-containing protein [Pelagicoccus sp. SDUM812002]|uniref:two-component regulator propeller domain-containing protein n=1 Tax=Pelagicoccus sp. SDUM812002 TaxID=3041266 RepID=UPI00280F4E87|nr:two-component regulator propeller domain-containing protein [Pelagicoccus sp. SDUM812002]MDQ8183996.1 two-component regulator propeller domain-containing protein [Pelagicoccus sp. SDUM812002]